jgi:hypothetical protein
VVCSLDLRNAFNMALRQKMEVIIREKIPELYPYFRMFYGGFPFVDFRTSEWESIRISVEEGGFQGDVLLSIFFALVYQPVLEEMARLLPVGFLKAYVDDTYFAGTLDEVLQVIEVVKTMGPEYGIVMNPAKTKCLLN